MEDFESDPDFGPKFLIDRYKERETNRWDELYSTAEKTSSVLRQVTHEIVEENDRVGDRELTTLYRICQHNRKAPKSVKKDKIRELDLPQRATEEIITELNTPIGSVGGRRYTLYVGGQDETKPEVERTLRDQLATIFNSSDTDELLEAVEQLTQLDYHSVQSGRMSPILHYLKPEIFPVINGRSITGMQRYFGYDIDSTLENYLTEREKYLRVRNNYDFEPHFRDIDWFFNWAEEDENVWTQAFRDEINRTVWQIQPGKVRQGFPEDLWPKWVDRGIISVGWEIGPQENLGDNDLTSQKDIFARQMETGDIVVAKHGHHRLLGLGVVTPDSYRYVAGTEAELHLEGYDHTDNHPSLRDIEWVFTVDIDTVIDTESWDLEKQFINQTVGRYDCFHELRYKLLANYDGDVLPELERLERTMIRLKGGSESGYTDHYELPIYKFLSNNTTRQECFERPLFGGNRLPDIEEGSTLVLYDYDQSVVYGPFKAADDLEENYADDNPWSEADREFVDQVPVTWTKSDLYRLPVDGPPGSRQSNLIDENEAETLLVQLRTKGTPIRIKGDGTMEERPRGGEGVGPAEPFSEALESAVEPDRGEIYRRAIAHLAAGKNVIFYGPPGSGKTRAATRLTNAFCAETRLETANAEWTRYDIVGGPAPADDGDGFESQKGIFTKSAADCQNHLADDAQPVWLIIDELNRANLDQAFGEVFTQLDLDYRDPEHELPIDDVQVPLAFRLIATMNTSDQAQLFSLGYAFRRRFAFVHVPSLLQSAQTDQPEPPTLDELALDTPDIDGQRIRSIINEGIDAGFQLESTLPGDTPLGLPQLQRRLEGEDSLPDTPTLEFALERDPLQTDGVDSLDVLIYLCWDAGKRDLVDIGQGLLIDATKYLVVRAVTEGQLTWADVDQAVLSYLLPQFDALMPDLRKSEISAGDGDVESELEEYVETLETLHLDKSAAALDEAQETKRVI